MNNEHERAVEVKFWMHGPGMCIARLPASVVSDIIKRDPGRNLKDVAKEIVEFVKELNKGGLK